MASAVAPEMCMLLRFFLERLVAWGDRSWVWLPARPIVDRSFMERCRLGGRGEDTGVDFGAVAGCALEEQAGAAASDGSEKSSGWGSAGTEATVDKGDGGRGLAESIRAGLGFFFLQKKLVERNKEECFFSLKAAISSFQSGTEKKKKGGKRGKSHSPLFF